MIKSPDLYTDSEFIVQITGTILQIFLIIWIFVYFCRVIRLIYKSVIKITPIKAQTIN